jgi:hypothetical protein
VPVVVDDGHAEAVFEVATIEDQEVVDETDGAHRSPVTGFRVCCATATTHSAALASA